MYTFKNSFKKTALAVATAAATSLAFVNAHAAEVEVLHWWTSGGEARAANVLKELMEAEGYGWEDFAVAGGGGETAMTVLKSRAMSGNPPSAAQIKGPEIQEWGELGLLGELDEVAGAEGWDELLPPTVAEVMRHDGSYVAVPVNVHRVNWLWANPEVLEAAGVEMPTTLDELETFKRLRELMDDDMSGRDWNIATSMVIEGTAGMQLMGDWAKGEFTAAGLTAGEEYLCAAAPGTQDAFTFNIDSLAMFRVEGEEREAQQALARLVLEPTFQEAFNLAKGSIPARPDLDMNGFDSCAQQSMQDFQRTAEEGGLVPSMAHGMAVRADVQGAIFDVVTNYFNSRDMAAEEAARRMVNAAQAAL
ncbi:ABC transporter substrate-binding protein [Halomonas sp. MCCC 1A11057]|uniref:ABC transporter substrate-binding protein n=1 Tax=Halomonas sp. MCCC 1A11057 TaxID=2733482 RepID=UPI001F28571D|nr:ABC transporter substrate-binding protein [Halomonas sp. MCCC 1A11057]